jgi:hypothetical protein
MWSRQSAGKDKQMVRDSELKRSEEVSEIPREHRPDESGKGRGVVVRSGQPIETRVEYLPSASIFEEFPEYLALRSGQGRDNHLEPLVGNREFDPQPVKKFFFGRETYFSNFVILPYRSNGYSLAYIFERLVCYERTSR